MNNWCSLNSKLLFEDSPQENGGMLTPKHCNKCEAWDFKGNRKFAGKVQSVGWCGHANELKAGRDGCLLFVKAEEPF